MLRVSLLGCSIVLLASCSTKRDRRALVIVSNEDSGDISIIDPARDDVVRTVDVGKRPRGLRVSPDGKLVFVALSGSPKAGPPPAAGPRPDDGDDKARDDAADGIGVVDLERGVLVRTLPAGRDPESFDVTPDGRQLYVSNEESSAVSVVDVASGRVVGTIAVGKEPEGSRCRPTASTSTSRARARTPST